MIKAYKKKKIQALYLWTELSESIMKVTLFLKLLLLFITLSGLAACGGDGDVDDNINFSVEDVCGARLYTFSSIR